jgi:hypothetical protein
MTFQGDRHRASRAQGARDPGRSKSMHEGVPHWYDCCSCEMEPYWREAMQGTDQVADDAPAPGHDAPSED